MPNNPLRLPTSTAAPNATVVPTATSTMATRSSSTTRLNTRSRSRQSGVVSSNDFAITAVLEMATTPAASRLSSRLQPSRLAAQKPRASINPISIMTASPSRGASRATRRTRNSRPTKNITSTTPISARARIVAGSEIRPRAISGPTATPAARYPGTSGSRNRWNTTVTSAATLRMIARSRRKWVAAASVTPERKADQGSRARTTDPSSGIRSGRPEMDRASAASGGWSVRRQSLAKFQTSTTPSTARTTRSPGAARIATGEGTLGSPTPTVPGSLCRTRSTEPATAP